MQNENERYVVVTTISTFRERYCIPVSKLQELNSEVDITNNIAEQTTWAKDEVTMENVKEFSQEWLGESIVDTFILDEQRVLNLFDRDNEYLSSWTTQQKLDYIHKWKDNRDV